LIVVHFAKRWRIPESEVTPESLHTHLGESAAPLVDSMVTADALRFGRREVERVELDALRSSIEESLRHAS
jgi:hypothetical protein